MGGIRTRYTSGDVVELRDILNAPGWEIVLTPEDDDPDALGPVVDVEFGRLVLLSCLLTYDGFGCILPPGWRWPGYEFIDD